MGLQDLQIYIEENCSKIPIKVELGKVAWRKRGGPSRPKSRMPLGQITPLFVVVDVESCLDRLYGGSCTDWVCGGQWIQMLKFIHSFTMSSRHQNIQFVFFFNGCTEKHRLQEWSKEQLVMKSNIRNVITHTKRKGTPPPRAWFVPPVAMVQCLRLALLDSGVMVAQSFKDHHREIMAYCRGNAFHGILAHSADFIVFDPPRYFSSHSLKLSRDARIISTTQFLLEELSKHLEIPPAAMPLLGTLLGNHILLEEEVAAFQWRLVDPEKMDLKLRANRLLLPSGNELIPAIAKYIRELPSPDDLDAVAKDVFSNTKLYLEEKIQKFKESVNYYRSATRNGGRASMHTSEIKHSKKDASQSSASESDDRSSEDDEKSEDRGNDEKSVEDLISVVEKTSLNDSEKEETPATDVIKESKVYTNGIQPITNMTRQFVNISTPPLPSVSPEVKRIAHHRHCSGLMHPYVYQLLTTGEVKLPVCIEDDQNCILPSVATFYRPARQHIYGILFSVIDKQSQKKVFIKEWWAAKGKSLWTPEIIEALPFPDWKVPTLQKLWLGREPEDKNRRMRAFLSCLCSDTPSMLNQRMVPPHVLMLACVLRYVAQTAPILQKHEVDTFLATALSPILNAHFYPQELETIELTVRGVLIASLVMKGVEIAMLANDVCGSPIPPMFAAPWNYFDGRIFQRKLSIASHDGANLIQICEGHVASVAMVEHLRQAILEGSPFLIAKSLYPPTPYQSIQPVVPQPYIPPGVTNKPHFQQLPPPLPFHFVPQNCAQLKVAGYTVGNWAGGDNGELLIQAPPPALGGYQSFDNSPNNHSGKLHRNIIKPNNTSSNKGRGMPLRGAGDSGFIPLEAHNMRPFYMD